MFSENFKNFCKISLFLSKKPLIFNSKTFSKLFNFSKITFLSKNFSKNILKFFFLILKFFLKILPIFELWKIFMHKNAIKNVKGVKFLEILAKNSCFSRVLGLFISCYSCFFGPTSVFFKKKFLITLFASLLKRPTFKGCDVVSNGFFQIIFSPTFKD